MSFATLVLAASLAVGQGTYTPGVWTVEIWPAVASWVDASGEVHDVPIYMVRYQADGCPAKTRTMPRVDLELRLLGFDLIIVAQLDDGSEIVFRTGSCLWTPPPPPDAIFWDGFESGDPWRWIAVGEAP